MAEEILERLRLSLMQDLLPIGIAIAERTKVNGPSSIFDAINSNQPLAELRMEGEPSAKNIRDQLDKIFPGLGNPVVSVKVSVEEESSDDTEMDNTEELMNTLMNIENSLEALEKFLQER
tara:strand:- start:441 stop:800 length:360 start_codon:yes stop_codon:yes gene_type:complete